MVDPHYDEDEIIKIFQPDLKPTLTDKEERKFFAWHKPRKHYLRVYQWCAEVRELITRNKYKAGDVLRYLGFPGEDFLDIRSLKGVCERANVKLRYLGFDSSATYFDRECQFNLSKHEVFHLGFIHEHSSVLKTRLETLANDNSIAYHRAAAFHDFDVINIDLCNSVASPTDETHPPYFDAIKKLCDLQVLGRTQPWVLFLTTRAIRDQIDPSIKCNLFACVQKNIRDHASFAARLQSDCSIDDGMIQADLHNKKPLSHSQLVNLFGLAIGKWLLGMMMQATPRLQVRLLKSYSYRVEIDEPDMLSLAFIFEPLVDAPIDSSGLTPPTKRAAAAPPSEEDLALDLLTEVLRIADVDKYLHENAESHSKMVQKCGEMLETVRYDKTKYAVWAEKNRWKPTK